MRDRLAELRDRNKEQNGDNEVSEVTVQMEEPTLSLGAFFSEVESIRRTLTEMEAAIRRLTDVHSRIHASAQPSAALRGESEDLEGQIRLMAIRVRQQLKGLGDRLPQPSSTATARMLSVQEASLGRRLQDGLSALAAEQVRHRERSQALLRRQLCVVRSINEEQAEEEAHRLLDQEHTSVFTDHHLAETRQARQQLADIEARKDELLTLERSIREVRDLFVDISLLVDAQGDMIDRIETHVLKTANHVEAGRKELIVAKKKKAAARKKKIFCIICITSTLIILLIVLGALAYSYV